jgi:2-phospho-L-lactate guanylyltransferase
MSTFALLPVNKPSEAKSRLAAKLTMAERRELVLCMTMDVLDALSGLPTVVVCPEDIRPSLREYEFYFLLQKRRGLNNAVEAANWYAAKLGAEATLFVPADVPLLSRETVREILSLGRKHRLIMSPSRRRGIGMLYRRPPELMRALFSDKSFDDNLEEASKKGIDAFIYRNPELYADIDTPEDVRVFLGVGDGTRSYELLKKLETRFK